MQHLEQVNGFFLPCCSYNNPNETHSRSFEEIRIAAISWVCSLVSRFIGRLWIFWQGFHRVGGNSLFPCMLSAPQTRSFACTTLPDSSHAWLPKTTATWTTSWEPFFSPSSLNGQWVGGWGSPVALESLVFLSCSMSSPLHKEWLQPTTCHKIWHQAGRSGHSSHEGTTDGWRSQGRQGMASVQWICCCSVFYIFCDLCWCDTWHSLQILFSIPLFDKCSIFLAKHSSS